MALPSSQKGEPPLEPPVQPLSEIVSHYLTTVREQQAHARYPALLQLWRQDHAVLYCHKHPKAGLITIAVEQTALTETALRELGEFRLQQFILCGWYDPERALADQAQTDPQLARVPASSVHLLVGTPEGQVLAYCSLQAAAGDDVAEPPGAEAGQYLHAFPRALFPAERELFGPVLFATLPALRAIPLTALGDFTCLLQNQALNSPLRTIAVIEAVLSMIHMLIDPASHWQAILGNMDEEARGLLASLGVPVLYAPQAQVVVDSLAYKHYWSDEEIGPLAQGKYWPFVVSVDDLRAHRDRFEQMHQAFSSEVRDIRRALVDWRRQIMPVAPNDFVPAAGTRAAQIWWTPNTLRKQRKKMSVLPGKRKDEPVAGEPAAPAGPALPSSVEAPVPEAGPAPAGAPVSADGLAQPPAGPEAGVLRYKTLSYDLLDLAPGMQVLDVGCGQGTDLSLLAARVGDEGLVAGVDNDPHLLQLAREAHQGRGNIRVTLSSAEHLPFAHRSFDALRADRLLQAVLDPAVALAEMCRVLRPGGVLSLVEADWQAVTLYPASPAGGDDDHTLRAVLQRACIHPLIGRRLYQLLHQTGKWEQIEIQVVTLVFTAWADANTILLLSKTAQALIEAEEKQAEDVQAWLQAVTTAAQQGDFFASLPLFFARARKIS